MNDAGSDAMMRGHLADMLTRQVAHVTFEQAVAGFPAERAGETVAPVPHSMWQLTEHIRLANRDMLDWAEAETYVPLKYPSGYWPDTAPPSPGAWEAAVKAVVDDQARFAAWAADPGTDLTAPLERDAGHSRLRMMLLSGIHASYHIGQIVDLRMLLGVPVRDW